MITPRPIVGAGGLALVTLALAWPGLMAQEAKEKKASEDDPIAVQARGPVHEAFAQPSEAQPHPSPRLSKKPPPPIPEEPPDQKPEGNDVQWIPGYWAWDADRNDYIWVSGFWRVPPPGRRWVPGHFVEAKGGWQWAPGFWASADQQKFDFLPEPPASVDNGPNIPAPNDNCFYLPGSWVYRDFDYVWRPGFWTTGHDDWVWNAACYRWTPAGYVYVDGYWDYPLADRGLLFAPVYFRQPYWLVPGWCYRPRFAVAVDGLFSSLWVWPTWGWYYFGDYYSPYYAAVGFYPWYRYGHHHYDSFYSYHYWHHHGDHTWYHNLHQTYIARRDGTAPRPPHTIPHSAPLAKGGGPGHPTQPQTVVPINQVRNDHVRLENLTAAQVRDQRTQAQRFRTESVQRSTDERMAARPTELHGATRSPSLSSSQRLQPSLDSGRRSFYSGPSADTHYRSPAAFPNAARAGGSDTRMTPSSRDDPRFSMPSRSIDSYRDRPSYAMPSTSSRMGPSVGGPSFSGGSMSSRGFGGMPSGGMGGRGFGGPPSGGMGGRGFGGPSGGGGGGRGGPSGGGRH